MARVPSLAIIARCVQKGSLSSPLSCQPSSSPSYLQLHTISGVHCHTEGALQEVVLGRQRSLGGVDVALRFREIHAAETWKGGQPKALSPGLLQSD